MKTLVAALLLALACPAFATGNHNPPPPKPPETSNHNQQNQNQGQHQGQQQGQGQHQGQTAQGGNGTGIGVGIGQGGNSDASATGGRSNATGGDSRATGGESASDASSSSEASSGVQGSGNSQLDASDRSSYSNRTNVFIPGDLPANAMTIAPGAYITTAGDTECGVLLTKVRTPIYQWDKKGKHKREAGYDEDVAPVFDGNGVQIDYQRVDTGNGSYYLRGSHVTYVLATAGGSSNSQLGLQGGGGGGYGGVSYGSGTAYSQAGVRILIRPCIAARFDAKPAVQTVARKAVKRKAVKRRAPAQCVPRAAKVCPAK